MASTNKTCLRRRRNLATWCSLIWGTVLCKSSSLPSKKENWRYRVCWVCYYWQWVYGCGGGLGGGGGGGGGGTGEVLGFEPKMCHASHTWIFNVPSTLSRHNQSACTSMSSSSLLHRFLEQVSRTCHSYLPRPTPSSNSSHPLPQICPTNTKNMTYTLSSTDWFCMLLMTCSLLVEIHASRSYQKTLIPPLAGGCSTSGWCGTFQRSLRNATRSTPSLSRGRPWDWPTSVRGWRRAWAPSPSTWVSAWTVLPTTEISVEKLRGKCSCGTHHEHCDVEYNWLRVCIKWIECMFLLTASLECKFVATWVSASLAILLALCD